MSVPDTSVQPFENLYQSPVRKKFEYSPLSYVKENITENKRKKVKENILFMII